MRETTHLLHSTGLNGRQHQRKVYLPAPVKRNLHPLPGCGSFREGFEMPTGGTPIVGAIIWIDVSRSVEIGEGEE